MPRPWPRWVEQLRSICCRSAASGIADVPLRPPSGFKSQEGVGSLTASMNKPGA